MQGRPTGLVRPVGPAEALPGPDDVRVSGVDPVVPELEGPGGEPVHRQGDRPIQVRIPPGLRLVQRAVPHRDGDATVGVTGRPRLPQSVPYTHLTLPTNREV